MKKMMIEEGKYVDIKLNLINLKKKKILLNYLNLFLIELTRVDIAEFFKFDFYKNLFYFDNVILAN